MLNWGTRFWPLGPEKVDWTVDLADGTFGPLRLGSTSDEIKTALGRPDYPQFFGVGRTLVYGRFSLYLSLDASQLLHDFQISMDEREDEDYQTDTKPIQPASPFANPLETSRFDPNVRLPGASSRSLRRLTLEDFERAFASWKSDQSQCYREWSNRKLSSREMVVYVDLMDDERTISTLGWMREEE